MCVDAENALKTAMEIKDSLIGAEKGKEEDMLKALGQMFVRVALMLADKIKLGHDGEEWSIDEIKKAFVDAMATSVGEPIYVDIRGGSLKHKLLSIARLMN